MKISITKFEKYNPRKDYATTKWIRLNTDLWFHPKLHGFQSSDFLIFIFLLTCFGRNRAKPIEVDHQYISDYIKLPLGTVRDSLMRLEKKSIISIVRSEPIETDRNPPYITEHNITERKEEEGHPSTKVDPPALPKLVKIWNDNIDQVLSKVIGISAKRRKRAGIVWRAKPDEAYWINLIQTINNRPFCLGKNDRGWKANFDWLIQDGVPDKVLEGNYGGANTKANKDKFFDFLPPEGKKE